MGTRHLIAVKTDDEYKIAQYGQWDGYPEGQGRDVLEFLQGADLDAFRDKARACRWVTEDEIKQVNDTENWTNVYPHLSRDAGAKILDMVMASDSPLFLVNTIAFAGDSLFCEYAYVIDFDKGVFEAYNGFNKTPTPANSRFPSGVEWLEKTDGYEPVALMKSWPLDDLPTVEGFLSDLCKDEGEDA